MNKRVEFSFYADRNETRSFRRGGAWQQRLHPRSWFITDVRLGPLESRLLHELLRQHSATLYYPYVMIDLRPTAAAGTAGQSSGRGVQRAALRPWADDPDWRWFYSHKYPPLRPVPHASSYGQCVVANLDPAGSGSVASETLRHLALSEPPLTSRTPTADLILLSQLSGGDRAQRRSGGVSEQAAGAVHAGGWWHPAKPWAGRGQLLGMRLRTLPARPPEAELPSAERRQLRRGEPLPGAAERWHSEQPWRQRRDLLAHRLRLGVSTLAVVAAGGLSAGR